MNINSKFWGILLAVCYLIAGFSFGMFYGILTGIDNLLAFSAGASIWMVGVLILIIRSYGKNEVLFLSMAAALIFPVIIHFTAIWAYRNGTHTLLNDSQKFYPSMVIFAITALVWSTRLLLVLMARDKYGTKRARSAWFQVL